MLLNKSTNYRYSSYSLEGEDILINRYFKEKLTGFYIDIGAHHPFRFNNTYFFYKKGWRGINIDPDKKTIDLFDKVRKRDININVSVGNLKTKRPFYQFNDPALNTFSKRLASQYTKLGYELTNTNKLNSKSLANILENNIESDTIIDFISIDVEGDEVSVLKSNNWKKYRPELIIVEALDVLLYELASSHKLTKFMKLKKYKLIGKTLTNLIFKNDTLHK